jgi:sirohydrochlorin ferrochelatase
VTRTGIIVFAHGSSVSSANDAVRMVTAQAARECGWALVETAFLEAAPPGLATAVATLVNQGASRVLVIPYFLTLGIHLQRDLPRIIDELSGIHPGVEIRVTPPLDGHPALAQILKSRAEQGLADWRNRE